MSRKPFKKGEMIVGEVVDILGIRDLILQVNGQLIRVTNKATVQKVRIGEKMELIVASAVPLRFELARRASQNLQLNISV